jgi:Uma2 family endonuclease
MSAAPRLAYSVEDYFALEAATDERFEFYHGEVFCMGGASREHNAIARNLTFALHGRLRGGPCNTYGQDLRVQAARNRRYFYPDLVVVCGEEQYAPDVSLDTLLNPTVVFEIASPSTESFDRGTKFRYYREVPSIQAVVLVAQDRPSVEVYERAEDESWRLHAADDLGAIARLDVLNVTLPLAEVYEGVAFPPEGDVPGVFTYGDEA